MSANFFRDRVLTDLWSLLVDDDNEEDLLIVDLRMCENAIMDTVEETLEVYDWDA